MGDQITLIGGPYHGDTTECADGWDRLLLGDQHEYKRYLKSGRFIYTGDSWSDDGRAGELEKTVLGMNVPVMVVHEVSVGLNLLRELLVKGPHNPTLRPDIDSGGDFIWIVDSNGRELGRSHSADEAMRLAVTACGFVIENCIDCGKVSIRFVDSNVDASCLSCRNRSLGELAAQSQDLGMGYGK